MATEPKQIETNGATSTPAVSGAIEVGALVRHLAHEIANPLNAIMMNAEMARSLVERGDKARATEALSRLLSDCNRCGKLIRGLQYFGAGLGEQEKSSASVKEIIEGATSTIVFEYEGSLPAFAVDATEAELHCDRNAIERALVALLRNAAEAGATEISVRARAAKGRVAIEISDNGSGMDEKSIERLTTGYYSTKRANGSAGLGIKLATELVRKHGGELSLRANSPKGLRVELSLPLECAD